MQTHSNFPKNVQKRITAQCDCTVEIFRNLENLKQPKVSESYC